MNVKTKLKEAELVDQQVAPVTAQPAASAEVAAAQDPNLAVPATDPALDQPVEVPEDVTAQEPVVPADPMTPPAPGMIPSGWVRPEDLAAAVAQATGDVEVAQTAPDAAVAEQPLVQEPVEPTAEAPVMEACEDKKDDKIEEAQDICPACGKNPCECEKEMKEADEHSDGDAAKAADLEQPLASDSREEQAPVDALQEDCDPIEDEAHADVEGLMEADEHSDGDAANTCDNVTDEMEADAAAKAAAPMDEACGKPMTEAVDDVEDAPVDPFADPVADDLADDDVVDFNMDILEDNPDFDMSVFEEPADEETDYNFDAAIHTDDVDEAIEGAADTLANTSEFLKSLLSDPGYYDDEDVDDLMDDDEDFAEEDDLEDEDVEDEDIDLDECINRIPVDLPKKEIVKDVKPARRELRVQEAQDVWYPAGSRPNDDAEDLVREYEKSSASRRLALAKLRESIKQRRTQEVAAQNRFNEALSRRTKLVEEQEAPTVTDSWSNSRFYEKYQEREKLDYKELLQNGFLG